MRKIRKKKCIRLKVKMRLLLTYMYYDAGNVSRVRALVFDSLKQRRVALHIMLLSVAATWPQVLSKSGQFCSNTLQSL